MRLCKYSQGGGHLILLQLALVVGPARVRGEVAEVKLLHLGAGPWGFAQEFEARADARIGDETANGHELAQLFPSIMGLKLLEDGFKGHAMERVVGVHAN